ncbi:vitamin K epoxide reductase family protein [Streptomyces sp. NPDC085524]|uniref:vitamin K epoxide reductase family protein n=2 Tax=unclassified Streptomyces TaxID=2593676 RepID=UPI0037D15188
MTTRRGTSLLLLIGGLLGTLASGVLTYDRIRTPGGPALHPGCNVGAVLSCGDVMTAWQGNLLGFPNMLLGTAGFAALSGLGAALLAGYAVVAVLILNRFGPALAG